MWRGWRWQHGLAWISAGIGSGTPRLALRVGRSIYLRVNGILTMATRRDIRFRFAPNKALSAIHWMVVEQPNVDLHTMLKSCYFADKKNLNQHSQPIFGATYRAMKFGPVPLEIYEMAKGEAMWLAELGLNSFPWRLDGYRLQLIGNDNPDMTVFTEHETNEIKDAFKLSSSLTFNGRTALTHGRDWQAAELGTMRYEDMFDVDSRTEEEIEYLRESAPFIKL